MTGHLFPHLLPVSRASHRCVPSELGTPTSALENQPTKPNQPAHPLTRTDHCPPTPHIQPAHQSYCHRACVFVLTPRTPQPTPTPPPLQPRSLGLEDPLVQVLDLQSVTTVSRPCRLPAGARVPLIGSIEFLLPSSNSAVSVCLLSTGMEG